MRGEGKMKTSTHQVLDIAKYFLTFNREDESDEISNLKLQKLLYYAQGFFLAIKDIPLFDEDIEAWTHGPVIPAIYHAYKHIGSGPIPVESGFNPETTLSAEVREILDEVYDVFGQFSAWKLRNMTHQEQPWKEAYDKREGGVIPKDALKVFFKKHVSDE